jgi:hypothetical protein
MTTSRSIFTRLALCLFAALVLGSAVQSAAASAAPFPIQNSLYTYRVSEGSGTLQYKVNIPCQRNRRVVGKLWRWNTCDYTISAQSGSAFYSMPGNGGDAYSYMRQMTDDSLSGPEGVFFPINIVDDSARENAESFQVKLVLTVRECYGVTSNNARYPNCNTRLGTYTRYGTVTILDND